MKKTECVTIGQSYEVAHPTLSLRSMTFLEALGLKNARKHIVEVKVRNSPITSLLSDDPLSLARIIRIELREVDSTHIQLLLANFTGSSVDQIFVTSLHSDLDRKVRIYSLINGGFLLIASRSKYAGWHCFVTLYRDRDAFCEDYPTEFIDKANSPSPLLRKVDASSILPVEDVRKIRVMNMLAKHNFRISVDASSTGDSDKMSIEVFPAIGGSWSDSREFTADDPVSYFEALESTIDQWLKENS